MNSEKEKQLFKFANDMLVKKHRFHKKLNTLKIPFTFDERDYDAADQTPMTLDVFPALLARHFKAYECFSAGPNTMTHHIDNQWCTPSPPPPPIYSKHKQCATWQNQ